MHIEIPDSSAFYVRTALNRAVEEAQRTVDILATDIENDRVPEVFKGSVFSVLRHTERWLKEAKAEFAKLPEQIRPDVDLLGDDQE